MPWHVLCDDCRHPSIFWALPCTMTSHCLAPKGEVSGQGLKLLHVTDRYKVQQGHDLVFLHLNFSQLHWFLKYSEVWHHVDLYLVTGGWRRFQPSASGYSEKSDLCWKMGILCRRRTGQMIGVASQWVSTSRTLSHPFMLHTQYSFHFSLFCSCSLTHCIVLLLALWLWWKGQSVFMFAVKSVIEQP